MSPAAMRRCLGADGIVLGEVVPRDERLQALRDLAQTTSFDATADGRSVSLAILATAGDAELLADLLTVPDDPYQVVVHGNVLVMYQPDAVDVYRTVVTCQGG